MRFSQLRKRRRRRVWSPTDCHYECVVLMRRTDGPTAGVGFPSRSAATAVTGCGRLSMTPRPSRRSMRGCYAGDMRESTRAGRERYGLHQPVRSVHRREDTAAPRLSIRGRRDCVWKNEREKNRNHEEQNKTNFGSSSTEEKTQHENCRIIIPA